MIDTGQEILNSPTSGQNYREYQFDNKDSDRRLKIVLGSDGDTMAPSFSTMS